MSWTIEYDNRGTRSFSVWWNVLDETGERVARCDTEEAAKQVAAIPDLRAACKAMDDALRDATFILPPSMRAARTQMQAAIVKAEPKAPETPERAEQEK